MTPSQGTELYHEISGLPEKRTNQMGASNQAQECGVLLGTGRTTDKMSAIETR